MKTVGKDNLMRKLRTLDEKLLQIWVDEELGLEDDERWELFVLLLESRVKLLITCRDAGMVLSPEDCMPSWLEKLTSNRKELRLRDLKLLYDEMKQRRNIKTFEEVARLGKREIEGEV